ncbi:MAG TPA: selenide, water dikinase SelD [Bdellovibrionota bacterium]|nr:selenide, water dikinase SelD [Bdellovibrionota bacterium]
MDTQNIRLTETVTKGGCAAKLPAGELRKVLSGLDLKRLPELAVGTETLDDACLWDLGDGRYLVQTLDFFTPIVDDAVEFGAIAAANALSDVYAMGGEPKTAMTILAFPGAHLPMDLIGLLMKGALSKIHESGACLAGGHTIDDETLKLGFSVSGFVRKDRAWTNAGAKAGDALILTKPLGTGTITSALKKREAKDEWVRGAVQSMTQLNRAVDLLSEFDVHAATDVTGFGLAGHALQMAQASHVSFQIRASALPALPGAMECLKNKVLNKAHRTNLAYAEGKVDYKSGVSEERRWLTLDPQTSGGLLLAVPLNQAQPALAALRKRFASAMVIGDVSSAGQYPLVIGG